MRGIFNILAYEINKSPSGITCMNINIYTYIYTYIYDVFTQLTIITNNMENVYHNLQLIHGQMGSSSVFSKFSTIFN